MSTENPFETPEERMAIKGGGERVLYSDKFVTLSNKTLEVEGFRFMTLGDRVKTSTLTHAVDVRQLSNILQSCYRKSCIGNEQMETNLGTKRLSSLRQLPGDLASRGSTGHSI